MKTKILGALAATLLVGAIAAPAAQAAAVGKIHFAGTANLATFPCDPGPCSGSFNGVASGKVSGTDGSIPWSAQVAGATMTAAFTYSELVVDCPTSGDAAGSFVISGGVSNGVYNGASVPVVRANGTFEWERTGLTAVIRITSASVTLNVGGTNKTIPVGPGTATAGFAPLGPPHCDAPAPTTAAVNGNAVFANP